MRMRLGVVVLPFFLLSDINQQYTQVTVLVLHPTYRNTFCGTGLRDRRTKKKMRIENVRVLYLIQVTCTWYRLINKRQL